MAGHGSQSNTKAWDLSLYELHRKPHEMVSDSTTIAVSPRALHNELMCPICLDLMRNAQTTKECLHRFCQECIITALRSGNKECPTCRKKLVSKRSLRPDPNFDALIANIYPNREELNAQQQKTVSRSRASVTVPRRKRKAPESRASTPDQENLPVHHNKRQKTASPAAPDHSEEPVPVPPSLPEQGQASEEVELQLRPHPADPNVSTLAIRNLATYPVATVSHLVKYLAIESTDTAQEKPKGAAVRTLSFDSPRGPQSRENYILYVQMDDTEYTALPSGTSLKQICENYWTPGDKLKLFFGTSGHLSAAPPAP